MKNIEYSEVNVNEMMRALREKAREYPIIESFPQQTGQKINIKSLETKLLLNQRQNQKINLNDLLSYYDKDFIHKAYHEILNRNPDEIGSSQRLQQLRQGECSRFEIIMRLRFSKEGRGCGKKVTPLWRPLSSLILSKIPIFGYFWRLCIVLINLPNLAKKLDNIPPSSEI